MSYKRHTGAYCAFLLLAMLVLSTSLRAQGNKVAPYFSASVGSPLFFNREKGIVNQFTSVDNATSFAWAIGGGVKLDVPALFAEHVGLGARLGVSYSSGKVTSSTIELEQGSTGRYLLSGNEWKLELGIPIRWYLGPATFEFGPTISRRISSSISEHAILDLPSLFPDSTRDHDITPASIASASTHVSIEGGIELSIPGSTIRPGLSIGLDLTELPLAGSNAVSIGASIAIPIALSKVPQNEAPIRRSDSIPTEQDTLVAVPIEHATPRIKFIVNGKEASEVPIERVEFHEKQYTMLESEILLKGGMEGLSTVMHLLSRRKAKAFTLSSLANRTIDTLQSESLNIIGVRLAQSPRAILNVFTTYGGAISEREAKRRNNDIQRYLDTTWHVPKSRVMLSTMLSSDAYCRTQLTSSDPNILAPVVTQWVVQSFHLPHLSVAMRIPSHAAQTHAALSLQGNTIVEYGGLQAQDNAFDTMISLDQDPRWQMVVGGLETSQLHDIIATLMQSDIAGKTMQYSDTLRISKTRTDHIATTGRKGYRFYFSSNAVLTQEPIVKLLLSRIQELLDSTPSVIPIEVVVSEPVAMRKDDDLPLPLSERIEQLFRAMGRKLEVNRSKEISRGILVEVEF